MEIASELNKVGDLQYKEFKDIKYLRITKEYKLKNLEE